MLVPGFPLFGVDCMCVNGTFGEDCAKQVASKSDITAALASTGFFPAPQQPQLSEEGRLYTIAELDSSLAGVRPRVAILRTTTRVVVGGSSCGVTTSVQGSGSSKPDDFSFVLNTSNWPWMKQSSLQFVPLDSDHATLRWSWTFYGREPGTPTHCDNSNYPPSNKVVLLGVFV